MSGLDFEDLEGVVKADGDPVLVRGVPLQLVDLALRREGQDRVLDHPRVLHRDVPDQRLAVVPAGADVTGGVGRPGDAVDGRVVPHQLRHRH